MRSTSTQGSNSAKRKGASHQKAGVENLLQGAFFPEPDVTDRMREDAIRAQAKAILGKRIQREVLFEASSRIGNAMRRDSFTIPLALPGELIVDNFAVGGGASTGIEQAFGRPVDVAVNHDPEAIAMHAINHPRTKHYCESVFKVDPEEITGNQPVGLAWFSPDCTHHSKARGAAPRSPRVRGLAWVVVRWARRVKPRVILLENVEEFQSWGPLDAEGYPIKEKAGMTFRLWLNQLRAAGYKVEHRELRACDYGAPTTRKRLFVIARRDGLPIVWPKPTHGPGLIPYRTAADCIDWSIPCPSIFGRAKPLAESTLRRIAKGIMKYVVNNPQPFIVPVTHPGDARVHSIDDPIRTITGANRGELALVSAFLAKHYGGPREGTNAISIDRPVAAVTAVDHHALVTSNLIKLRGDNIGQPADEPLRTISAGGTHFAEVRALLLKFYGTDQDPRLEDPLHTITTKDRFGIVTVAGEPYAIADIGMRMLQPRELYRAQGFPDDYVIDFDHNGRPLPKHAQVRMCGNSVCPPLAKALVEANFAHEAAWMPRKLTA